MKKFKPTLLSFPNDNRNYYVPSDLSSKKLKELSKEYTRLRDIAHKRIERLKKEPKVSRRDIERYEKMIPKIKDLKGETDLISEMNLRYALSDVSRLLNKEASTIPKARQKAFDDFNKFQEAMDYLGIDEETRASLNPDAFWDFVDYTKNVMNDNLFYWGQRKMKYMHDNKEVVKKINQHEFASAIGVTRREQVKEEFLEEYRW